jgi:predicted transcriptional regulator of viral defense system
MAKAGKSQTATVLELARKSGMLRGRDLTARGVHPEQLRRLVRRGLLTRTARGLYMLAGQEVPAEFTLASAAKRVPQGVICLFTALRFHEIGTQNPPEIWMALPRRAAIPRVTDLPLRFVRLSGESFTAGVDTHVLNGVPVRITNPAKTVADCFKFRLKLGLDVAIEALREGRRARRFTMDELWRYAKICRVANVMRPYMEAFAI